MQSPLELDGYLTGVIVTPQTAPIRPHKWIAGLWNEDESIFDDTAVMKAVLDAVIERYTPSPPKSTAASTGCRPKDLRLPAAVPVGRHAKP